MIINLYNLIYIKSCAGEKRINKPMGVLGKYLIIYYVSIYGTYFIVPIYQFFLHWTVDGTYAGRLGCWFSPL